MDSLDVVKCIKNNILKIKVRPNSPETRIAGYESGLIKVEV